MVNLPDNLDETKFLRLLDKPSLYCSDISELVQCLQEKEIHSVQFGSPFLDGLDLDDQSSLFDTVAEHEQIKEFCILGGKVKVEVIARALGKLRSLKVFFISNAALEGNMEHLEALEYAITGLEELSSFNMSNVSFSDPDAHNFDYILRGLARTQVTDVRLEARKGGEIKVDNRAYACFIHGRYRHLVELHLVGLRFKGFQFGAFTSSLISKSKTLQSLSVLRGDVNDHISKTLATSLSETESLQKLDFSFNDIGNEGCRALSNGLENNQSIKFVNIWGNPGIGPEGLAYLSDMLSSNTTLERLNTPDDDSVRSEIDKRLSQNRKQKSTNAVAA